MTFLQLQVKSLAELEDMGRIGRGGSGVVHKMLHKGSHRVVAVKVDAADHSTLLSAQRRIGRLFPVVLIAHFRCDSEMHLVLSSLVGGADQLV
jgi:hypothetical protein